MCKEKNKKFLNKKANHGGRWLKGKFKKNSKKKPLISIITVTLNSQKYLAHLDTIVSETITYALHLLF